MLEKLVQKLLPLIAVGSLYADTSMTVIGPVVTTGEYISTNPGQEKRWRYDITNTSSSGDINNMINWQVNVGVNNNILNMTKTYSGAGTINLLLTPTTAGFTGLLPPNPTQGTNNFVRIYIYTSLDTPSALGLATAIARGNESTPFSPPSGPVTGSSNGPRSKSKFLAVMPATSNLTSP